MNIHLGTISSVYGMLGEDDAMEQEVAHHVANANGHKKIKSPTRIADTSCDCEFAAVLFELNFVKNEKNMRQYRSERTSGK